VTRGIEQDELLPDSLYFLFAKVSILHRDGPLPVPLCCPDLLPQRALPMTRRGRVDAARLHEARWAYRALKPAWRVGGAAASAERGDETSRALWWPVSAPPCSPPGGRTHHRRSFSHSYQRGNLSLGCSNCGVMFVLRHLWCKA
jgi:hypothetical protein